MPLPTTFPTDAETTPAEASETPAPTKGKISRRAVLGTMATSIVVAACDVPGTAGPGDEEAGPSDTVVRPEDGRFPDSLPLVDDGNNDAGADADADADNGTTTTTKPKSSTTEGETTTTTKKGDKARDNDGGDNGGNNGGGGNKSTTTTAAVATTVATTIKSSTTAKPATTAPPTTASTTTSGPVSTPTTSPPPPTTAAPTTTAPPTTAPTTTAPPPPPPPETTVLLLANRATFGTTPEVESDITQMGLTAWIDQQIAWNFPDPAVENLLSGPFRSLSASRQQAYAISQEDDNPTHRELVHSNVLRARYSRYQVYEMMAHLWADHFNVNITSGRYRHLHIDYQENVIRPNALGRFEDLLRATAESPAMMVYLDNAFSNANSNTGVNENYGRELLELHTLGINPDGSQIYTEADVVAASHIMSGWSVVTDRDAGNFSDFQFRDNYHTNETVSILGGAFSNSGRPGKSAGDALITFLANHPQTARHIAYKIIRRFVSDTPPESLVASTAQVYLANGTALGPTVRHVLLSGEFASSAGEKLRRPFEIVTAAFRSLGTNIPIDPYGQAADTMRYRLRDLGQEPWAWEQPDGYEDVAGPWLTSDGLLERWAFTARAANNFHSNQNEPGAIVTDLRALVGNATTVDELVESFRGRFGIEVLSDGDRNSMLAALNLNGTDAVDSLQDETLGELASFLMAHPFFQIR